MLTQEQLSERLDYVCGSDAGVVAGYSNYKTPVELWAEKTGRWTPPDISDKPAVKAGNKLEEALIKWFEDEMDCEVKRDEGLIRCEKYPHAAANIDGRVVSENAIVEVKTTASDKGWGEGTNEIPPTYYCQVQHYLAVTDANRAYVVVLIRGSDFRIYIVERDQGFIDALMQLEEKFWRENVLADVAPEPLQVSDILQLESRLEREVSREAAEDEVQKLMRLNELEEKIRELKQEADSIKADLILGFGTASSVTDGNERTLASVSRVKTERFDAKKFKEDNPGEHKKYLKTSEYIKFTPRKIDWSEYV